MNLAEANGEAEPRHVNVADIRCNGCGHHLDPDTVQMIENGILGFDWDCCLLCFEEFHFGHAPVKAAEYRAIGWSIPVVRVREEEADLDLVRLGSDAG
jgi:hypothetical protein